MRVKASERIHTMFRGAPVIVIKYKDTFAEGYAQYKDDITAFFAVWYRDLLVHTNQAEADSQHDRAMQYIQSMVG